MEGNAINPDGYAWGRISGSKNKKVYLLFETMR